MYLDIISEWKKIKSEQRKNFYSMSLGASQPAGNNNVNLTKPGYVPHLTEKRLKVFIRNRDKINSNPTKYPNGFNSIGALYVIICMVERRQHLTPKDILILGSKSPVTYTPLILDGQIKKRNLRWAETDFDNLCFWFSDDTFSVKVDLLKAVDNAAFNMYAELLGHNKSMDHGRKTLEGLARISQIWSHHFIKLFGKGLTKRQNALVAKERTKSPQQAMALLFRQKKIWGGDALRKKQLAEVDRKGVSDLSWCTPLPKKRDVFFDPDILVLK